MVVVPRLRPGLNLDHPVQWRTASPLWQQAATNNESLLNPAILRFTTDDFMEDFLTVATRSPDRLGEWRVQKETWRKPAPIPSVVSSTLAPAEDLDPELESQPLKLFQPAHQRYYLVTANLVCRIPGFPDRTLKTNNDEQVSFVVRRFLRPEPDAEQQEHALVNGAWQPLDIGEEQQLLPGEEQNPMFPTTYVGGNSYQRRLFAGLIPVGNREAYMTAERQTVASTSSLASVSDRNEERIEQLLTVLGMDVAEPWRAINRLKELENDKLLEAAIAGELNPSTDLDPLNQARDKLQLSSWYVLLDFARYLQRYLPQVWTQIQTNPDGSVPSSFPGRSLLLDLQDATFTPPPDNLPVTLENAQSQLLGDSAETDDTVTMAAALATIFAQEDMLEGQFASYKKGDTNWPTTLFLLCGRDVEKVVDSLRELIREALIEDPSALNQRIPLVPLSQKISATSQDDDYEEDQFVIRCVFQRPHCPPSLRPTVVSQPTVSFQMASYFDPDAPARPIRIPMPIDASPAGLRKFAKNTSFILSDSLSCQIDKAQSLTFGDLVLSVLPWPFRKGLNVKAGCNATGLAISKICTLSIPIITICALILLFIFVLLLDIIFKWVPYLIFCLPLPGLKAKESD